MNHAQRRESRLGWTFIAPAFLHLLVFALIPIGYAAYLSLFKWQLAKESAQFVGVSNYLLAFTEEPFWNAMANSFRYTVTSVPLGMALALAVAVLVNQKLRGVTAFRALYYLPSITSGVAISMLWIYVYLPDTGLMNTMLLGLIGPKGSLTPLAQHIPGFSPYTGIDFLNRTEWAMWALVFMSAWVGLGPRMVLFLAGLVNIPPSLYEAAELDGATGWRAFRSVTLPMLGPTSLFVMITSTIGAMQVFTPVYMMTQGGPEGSTDLVGYHIYTEAWLNFNTGLASAKSFVLLAVIALMSVLQFRLTRAQTEGFSASGAG